MTEDSMPDHAYQAWHCPGDGEVLDLLSVVNHAAEDVDDEAEIIGMRCSFCGRLFMPDGTPEVNA